MIFITKTYSILKDLRNYIECFGRIKGIKLFLLGKISESRIIEVKHPKIKNSIYLRLNESAIATLMRVFIHEEYNQEIAIVPKIIIDAGAYNGLTSIFYAEKYPKAKIIAIEPELSNFMILKKNVSMYSNITPINKALWSKNTNLDIIDRGTGNWGFKVENSEDVTKEKKGHTEGLTLEEIIKSHEIDYIDILKIDIEGAEREVFQTANVWVNSVGMIAIELHDRISPGCSRSFYNATNDFEHEVHKGEIVFVIRDKYFKQKPISKNNKSEARSST